MARHPERLAILGRHDEAEILTRIRENAWCSVTAEKTWAARGKPSRLSSKVKPFEEGGQKPGQRYSGGRDTTHAVLYALDPATGDELYTSGDSINSWNHYGGIALSDGNIYVSSYDARLFAFGLKK